MPIDFLVDRTDLRKTETVEAAPQEAEAGTVVLRIDRFALMANNITYGVAGDMIGYWNFFPAREGMGRIPVWGIGTVVRSGVEHVSEGQRFYGYYPMSSELKVKPDNVSPRGFTDASDHRSQLPIVYNQYSLMNSDNGFDDRFDNHAILYRPLFTTSFVLDDFFRDNNFFGAEQIILGSASSKTAFGLAFMLRDKPVKVVGLTSSGNKAFVEGLGLYDDVLLYDDVASLDNATPAAYVDMAGNRQILAAVHHHFADNLVYSCGVGITHWESRDGAAPDELPGAKPAMFFAPSQIVKRNEELGPAVYQQKIAAATNAFFAEVDQWVNIKPFPFSEMDNVYHTVLGGPSPDVGYVVAS